MSADLRAYPLTETRFRRVASAPFWCVWHQPPGVHPRSLRRVQEATWHCRYNAPGAGPPTPGLSRQRTAPSRPASGKPPGDTGPYPPVLPPAHPLPVVHQPLSVSPPTRFSRMLSISSLPSCRSLCNSHFNTSTASRWWRGRRVSSLPSSQSSRS